MEGKTNKNPFNQLPLEKPDILFNEYLASKQNTKNNQIKNEENPTNLGQKENINNSNSNIAFNQMPQKNPVSQNPPFQPSINENIITNSQSQNISSTNPQTKNIEGRKDTKNETLKKDELESQTNTFNINFDSQQMPSLEEYKIEQNKVSSNNIDFAKELTTSENISSTIYNWNDYLNNNDNINKALDVKPNLNYNKEEANLGSKNATYARVIKDDSNSNPINNINEYFTEFGQKNNKENQKLKANPSNEEALNFYEYPTTKGESQMKQNSMERIEFQLHQINENKPNNNNNEFIESSFPIETNFDEYFQNNNNNNNKLMEQTYSLQNGETNIIQSPPSSDKNRLEQYASYFGEELPLTDTQTTNLIQQEAQNKSGQNLKGNVIYNVGTGYDQPITIIVQEAPKKETKDISTQTSFIDPNKNQNENLNKPFVTNMINTTISQEQSSNIKNEAQFGINNQNINIPQNSQKINDFPTISQSPNLLSDIIPLDIKTENISTSQNINIEDTTFSLNNYPFKEQRPNFIKNQNQESENLLPTSNVNISENISNLNWQEGNIDLSKYYIKDDISKPIKDENVLIYDNKNQIQSDNVPLPITETANNNFSTDIFKLEENNLGSYEEQQNLKYNTEFPITDIQNTTFSYDFPQFETQNLPTKKEEQQKQKDNTEFPIVDIQDTAFTYDLSQFETQNLASTNEIQQKPKEKAAFPIADIQDTAFSYDLSQFETQNLASTNEMQQKPKEKAALPITDIQDTAFTYDFSQFGTQNSTSTNEVQQKPKEVTSFPINEIPDTAFSTDFSQFATQNFTATNEEQKKTKDNIAFPISEIPETNISENIVPLDYEKLIESSVKQNPTADSNVNLENNFTTELTQFDIQDIISTYEKQNNQKDTSALPITEMQNTAFSQFETQNFETYEPTKQDYNTAKPLEEIKGGITSENTIPFEINQLIESSEQQKSTVPLNEIPKNNYLNELSIIDTANLYNFESKKSQKLLDDKTPKTTISSNGAVIKSQELAKYNEESPHTSTAMPIQETSISNLAPIEELQISDKQVPRASLKIKKTPFSKTTNEDYTSLDLNQLTGEQTQQVLIPIKKDENKNVQNYDIALETQNLSQSIPLPIPIKEEASSSITNIFPLETQNLAPYSNEQILPEKKDISTINEIVPLETQDLSKLYTAQKIEPSVPISEPPVAVPINVENLESKNIDLYSQQIPTFVPITEKTSDNQINLPSLEEKNLTSYITQQTPKINTTIQNEVIPTDIFQNNVQTSKEENLSSYIIQPTPTVNEILPYTENVNENLQIKGAPLETQNLGVYETQPIPTIQPNLQINENKINNIQIPTEIIYENENNTQIKEALPTSSPLIDNQNTAITTNIIPLETQKQISYISQMPQNINPVQTQNEYITNQKVAISSPLPKTPVTLISNNVAQLEAQNQNVYTTNYIPVANTNISPNNLPVEAQNQNIIVPSTLSKNNIPLTYAPNLIATPNQIANLNINNAALESLRRNDNLSKSFSLPMKLLSSHTKSYPNITTYEYSSENIDIFKSYELKTTNPQQLNRIPMQNNINNQQNNLIYPIAQNQNLQINVQPQPQIVPLQTVQYVPNYQLENTNVYTQNLQNIAVPVENRVIIPVQTAIYVPSQVQTINNPVNQISPISQVNPVTQITQINQTQNIPEINISEAIQKYNSMPITQSIALQNTSAPLPYQPTLPNIPNPLQTNPTTLPYAITSAPYPQSLPNVPASLPYAITSVPNIPNSFPNARTSLPNLTTTLPYNITTLPYNPALTNITTHIPYATTSIPNVPNSLPNITTHIPYSTTSLPYGRPLSYLPILPNAQNTLSNVRAPLSYVPKLPYSITSLPYNPGLPNAGTLPYSQTLPNVPTSLPNIPNSLPYSITTLTNVPNSLPYTTTTLPYAPTATISLPNIPNPLPYSTKTEVDFERESAIPIGAMNPISTFPGISLPVTNNYIQTGQIYAPRTYVPRSLLGRTYILKYN